MTLVVDASVVVSGLIDDGPDGRWCEGLLAQGVLIAPHLLPAEVASILRRATIAGHLGSELAALAHQDLARLSIDLVPYEPFADRVWELRDNVTPYDAWYVALAEWFALPVATLDARLVRAPGPRCAFLTPPAA